MFAPTESLMVAAMLSPLLAAFLGVCYAIDCYRARRPQRAMRRRLRRISRR